MYACGWGSSGVPEPQRIYSIVGERSAICTLEVRLEDCMHKARSFATVMLAIAILAMGGGALQPTQPQSL
ncbi:hypothetical protein KIM372_00730 [Bombiscardovia nodaiensis]|uniref:Uncharacterized protein n=1 Tax=Bombiscardovia nodaiensis TaxID=2932181 RepID=A0ABM8B5Q2_9BIFI|nr:hypothetical protein KIM372_00730 [Bombiscardovia nodaiensis]